MNKISIRKYRSEDCSSMAKMFYDTVHTVNAADYSIEQLNAWATGDVNIDELEKWAIGRKIDTIITHASITAKGYFECRRYNVIKKQKVIRCGIELVNYIMEKI